MSKSTNYEEEGKLLCLRFFAGCSLLFGMICLTAGLATFFGWNAFILICIALLVWGMLGRKVFYLSWIEIEVYFTFMLTIMLLATFFGWNAFIFFCIALLVLFISMDVSQKRLTRATQRATQLATQLYDKAYMLKRYCGSGGLLKCPACSTNTKLFRWVDGTVVRQEGEGQKVRYTVEQSVSVEHPITLDLISSNSTNISGRLIKMSLRCPSCGHKLNFSEIDDFLFEAKQIWEEDQAKTKQIQEEEKTREQHLVCPDCEVSSPESDWAEHGHCPNCGSDREPYLDPNHRAGEINITTLKRMMES